LIDIEVYMIFVFIGGASGSGKTGLSKHVLNQLIESGVSAQVLNMDDYYHERPLHVNVEEFRKHTNFDTPDMLHLDLFRDHLAALSKGNSITKPLFVFATNRREGEEVIKPSEVIIVEGIFAQYFYKNFLPVDLAAFSVNVATDNYLDIVERRIKRDIEHRGRARADCLKQEQEYVGPGFLKYTASSSTGSDLYVLNGHKDGEEEQHLALIAEATEIIAALEKLRREAMPDKRPTPKVQEMVAKSHLVAGTLFNPRKFEGHFSGVFGNYKGNYVREFSKEEAEEIQHSMR
jgi:uridine kinase